MSIFKRTQRKYVKKAYRVRNWREYEAGLRNRGSLTVWISLTAGKLVNWDAPRPRRRKPGRQRKYSNHAIETAVTLGMVFHLSSRQSEGLLRSLFALMKLDNDVPDHTTLSRRKPKLGKVPFYQVKQKTPLHILIDSSGLAVHAGQLRRAQKSRDYRKLHLCVDGCLRCLLLVMCTHPFAKEALTLHLARSEGHECYFGCNLMHRRVLASSHQHLMAEAPVTLLANQRWRRPTRSRAGPACS